ncbi:TRAM domain-containing protein [bacterium]|nr:TRAM domain-containing protein [bacterium]
MQSPHIELELESMTPSGDALGRADGMVVFVPFGVAGERVSVRLVQHKKRFARGEIVEILRPSPQRTSPRCAYFGRCGGCEWQHIDYPAQVTYKTAIVEEQFRRIGRFEDAEVRPCLPSPSAYRYRSRARLARSERNRPGYRAAQSHAVIEVEDCPILEDSLNRKLHGVVESGLNNRRGDWELRPDTETIQVGEFEYRVSPDSFFQINLPIATQLVDEVMARLQLTGKERVLDLYCGVGLFTLPISLNAATVTGVEFSPTATNDAQYNLAALYRLHPHMAQSTVLTGAVEETLSHAEIVNTSWDVILVDPPRAGLDGIALAQIVDLSAPRIVYVSCDPATLARDARVLVDAGYHMGEVQPLDMFPQTHHVECVVGFSTHI